LLLMPKAGMAPPPVPAADPKLILPAGVTAGEKPKPPPACGCDWKLNEGVAETAA
jgi:hypothetical protein